MNRGTIRMILLSVVTCLAILSCACEKQSKSYYQCITAQGRGSSIKNYIVYLKNSDNVPLPGLVILAKCSGSNQQIAAYANINNNRYDIPPITCGLNVKVVVPLKAEHLTDGINRIDFFCEADECEYEVIDCRIASVEETTAQVVGQTYRILGRYAPVTLSNFDFVMKYDGSEARKKEDLPDWAQRGKVRFYRAGIDFDHVDRMFEMFKEAHINLVLLQVATPSDLKSEEYKRYKAFIDRCHENNIKVMYDGGAGNLPIRLNAIMLEGALAHPEWREWISKDEFGVPKWRGRPGRIFMPDITIEDYRKEVLKNTEIAINAGSDELYYDWAVGGTQELMRFFLDVRELANKIGKNITIYANTHGHILVNGVCDIDKSEGTAEPGLWPDGTWVHNVSQARFYYATGDGWKPYRSKYGGGRTPTMRDDMRACWQRPLAEASAFQSHFAIAETGNKLRDGWVLKNNKVALEIWDDICQYNKFFDEEEELYTDVTTVADVGLVAPPLVPSFFVQLDREPIYDALVEMNIMYDVLLLPRLSAEKLAQYKTLLIPDLPWVTDEQLTLLKEYVKDGGKIYTLGSSDDLKEIATIWSPASLSRDMRKSAARKEFFANLKKLTGQPLVSIKGSKYVLANLVKKQESGRLILHFVNYAKPVRNLKVSVNLEGLVDSIKKDRIKLFSPDEGSKNLQSVKVKNKTLEFVLPELKIYDVVVVD